MYVIWRGQRGLSTYTEMQTTKNPMHECTGFIAIDVQAR